ncbi:MAG TPA: methylated-DNA--[protein]-cysteine S-methyltransferase [Thermoanaerobaculia bacterium]|jgi:methylated-DNA-[protein]-cysteine S-methyltransferase|nr:methylated-DNA--[protein]-cysteine S-methyltransferase [Thermoanaerobaculia bacterium]
MTTWYTATLDSPCGPLFCVVDPMGAVVRIEFQNGRDGRNAREWPHFLLRLREQGIEVVEDDGTHTAALRGQLAEYFAGQRQDFDLTLAPKGTEFELSVWEQLRRIPFGETRSYGEIAQAIGRPGAARAVGRANGANPIPIVVPCHRVIGSDGSLTGFGGGLEAKSRLLEIEGKRLPF